MSSTEQSASKVRGDVQEYYGKILQSSKDLITSACTYSGTTKSKLIKDVLKQIHPKVIEKFYGCGIPIPECLEGSRIVDLGSGSGRDCFLLSKLVGCNGKVIGVDMTDEQIATAQEYIAYHTELFGFSEPNVEFVKGYIEDLISAGIQSEHFDVIISNCVVNLSPDKQSVLKEAYKVLKSGGEFYFSDVFVNIPLTDDLISDEILRGECISGAFHWDEFLEAAANAQFAKPRLVTCNPIEITDLEVKNKLGNAKFASATYRLFKLPDKTESSQLLEYQGSIPECDSVLPFDKQITFKTSEPILVDSSVLTFIKFSRYKNHFKFLPTDQPLPNEIPLNPFLVMTGDASAGCCIASVKDCCKSAYSSRCQEEVDSDCCQGKS